MLAIGLFMLRIVIGAIFIAHGTQKLFGWFGGPGLEGVGRMMEGLNVQPARLWAVILGASETLGGLGFLFGFLTPFAAALIIGVMLVAIFKVHWKKGFFNKQGGIEFPLMNLTVAFFLGLVGPGVYSLDAVSGILFDPVTFWVALVIVLLGVIASMAAGSLLGESRHQEPSH